MSAPLHPALDPARYADASARDDRFDVKDRWVDLANLPDNHPDKQVEFLHRQMNEEVLVMENAARNLHEFPDVEWEVRYWLARQVSDEARHAQAYRGAVERRGGHVGMYPVLSFQYRVLGRVHSLIGRLAVQNRTFEADGLDAVTHAIEEARANGDDDLVRQYEAQQADEVLHIRFANEYIHREIKRNPRSVLDMTRALTLAAQAFKEAWGGGGTEQYKYGVAEEPRAQAGFSAGEIAEAVRISNERRGVATGAAG
jgi:uncharacterized ferritin-like protein (DUF455 family)